MWQKIKNIYHLVKAFVAAKYYGYPANSLKVIGVTGTDGKTTTANLIYHILKESGKKVAVISTISAIIEDKEYDTGFHVTTPSSFALQSYLQLAKNKNIEIVIIEVTSHALDQNRVYGIPFLIGVLTNITREHLDYHKTLDNYMSTKLKLLKHSQIAVVNRDDHSYAFIKKNISAEKLKTYSLEKNADFTYKKFNLEHNLFGEYNKYNVLAAVSVCLLLGVDLELIKNAVKTYKLPKGRSEIVYDDDFKVMIDFAHTPFSISQLLKTVRETIGKDGRIIHVFGSAGKRDKGKREKMGEASAEYANIIILTSEDPRGENINEINDAIKRGIQRNMGFRRIEVLEEQDRKIAIQKAIQFAKKGDFVVITGKGHEKSMNYGRGEESWSEYDAVKEAIKYRYKN